MQTLEEQVKEGEATLTKLNEDIAELTARRSNLQNEIEVAIKDRRDELEAEYLKKMNDLAKGISDFDVEKKDFEAIIQGRLEHLSGQETDYKTKEDNLAFKIADFEDEKKSFELFKEKELAAIAQANTEIEEARAVNEAKSNENNNNVQTLLELKKKLDQREFDLNNQKAEVEERASLVQADIDKSNEALNKATDTLKSIEEEKALIFAALEEQKKIKADLENMESVKTDIAKLEALKVENASKEMELLRQSKLNASIQEKLAEDKIAQEEKERFILLEQRKNDEKIAIIKKLREDYGVKP